MKKVLIFGTLLITGAFPAIPQNESVVGKEVALPEHLQDGKEYELSIARLVQFGEKLFSAKWTIQEGAGRPNVKGTANGPELSDRSQALVFPRNFNRISGPDSNSCRGCHNDPFEGGGGDRATLVFVLGQRFDFATFDHANSIPTEGAADELGRFVTLPDHSRRRVSLRLDSARRRFS